MYIMGRRKITVVFSWDFAFTHYTPLILPQERPFEKKFLEGGEGEHDAIGRTCNDIYSDGSV